MTELSQSLTLRDVAARASQILDEVERAVVGKRQALELALTAMLADGHVLIEDYPGLAKTLIARSLATVTGSRFSRVQFTPDLMPSDVTGASIFNQRSAEFEFRPGPVFTNVLLADEINRAPPKTQAALLEAMQERQVTTDDRTRPLERPFLVLATQNPIEYEGTYALPEAQLDRFLIRMRVGYPCADSEWLMLERRLERREDELNLREVVERAELVATQQAVETVHVSEGTGRYIVAVVAATRESPSVQVGASPRGTLALTKLARVSAALEDRDFVGPTTSRVWPCRRSRTGSRCAPSCGSSESSPRRSYSSASTRCQCRSRGSHAYHGGSRMRVKARAVVVQDGKLLVSRERRRGIERLLLPGGRVRDGESVLDTLTREVIEETGVEVIPSRLLYVAEVVGMYGVHDLNLIWLADPKDPRAIDDGVLVPLDSDLAEPIMPPIAARIAADAADGWPAQAQWLGNIRSPAAPNGPGSA